jgi:hypothetical protein
VGSSTPASYRRDGEVTAVPLALKGNESLFILFRKAAAKAERVVPDINLIPVGALDGPWTVSFQAGRGAPASTTLPQLAPLSSNSDPAIRYFSGEAVYTKSFRLPKRSRTGQPLWLDLGAVGDIAQVSVNGKKVGTAWHAPFRVDIGPAVHAGENSVEVKVANLWVNRLIGDEQPGAVKTTFVTIPTYKTDAPLRPSGLIGPVQILASE